jgi:hypothetical protein
VVADSEAQKCDSCGDTLISDNSQLLPELPPLIPAESLTVNNAPTVTVKVDDLVNLSIEVENATAGQPEPEKPISEASVPSAAKVSEQSDVVSEESLERHGDAILVLDSQGKETLVTHWIESDVTLIGREDPQRDIFPDLDLGKIPGIFSQGVSRQHLRLLRTIVDGRPSYKIFIFKGSTSTQIGADIIDARLYGQRIQIELGSMLNLGGRVWLQLVRL